MNSHSISACALILTAAVCGAAQADDALGDLLKPLTQQKSSADAKDLLGALVADMPMTTSPATFVLGASDMEVPRVSTFRTFASSVGRAIGKDGKPSTSMAVEIAPYLALKEISWSDFDGDFNRSTQHLFSYRQDFVIQAFSQLDLTAMQS